MYKLKTLLRVSATDFGSERVIKSCLFFQSSHMNSSTTSYSSLTVQYALTAQYAKLPRLFVILSRNFLNELLLLYPLIFLSFSNIAMSLDSVRCASNAISSLFFLPYIRAT